VRRANALPLPVSRDQVLDARLIVEHFSGTTRTQAIADPGRR
jgi:release factor glutamine methyltransferase